MKDTNGRYARREDLATTSCVECGLIDEIAQLTLCGNCSQAVHFTGLCSAMCPFCGALICHLCIDSSRTGGWHVCGSKDPDDAGRRLAWA